jgi:hypothetical protein
MWCNGKAFVSQCEGEGTKSSLLQLGRLHIVIYANKSPRVPRYVFSLHNLMYLTLVPQVT